MYLGLRQSYQGEHRANPVGKIPASVLLRSPTKSRDGCVYQHIYLIKYLKVMVGKHSGISNVTTVAFETLY